MRKNDLLKKVAKGIAVCSVLFSAFTVNAQVKQYFIGTPQKSEIAVAVRVLSDSSSIIAGYNYNLMNDTNAVVDADMILLRVKKGAILWEKTWGTVGNNTISDMIIAHNGDIIVVGSVGFADLYDNNTAAIFRFSQANGSLLNQGYVHDTDPSDIAGETFASVCELGNGNIVAVGAHDGRPGYGDGLISTFSSSLALIYNDKLQIGGAIGTTDGFNGVTVDPNHPNNIFACGAIFNNTLLYDGRIISYIPPTAPVAGVINWENEYDYRYHSSQSNYFASIKAVNNRLVIDGWVSNDCCGLSNAEQNIFSCDLTGAAANVKMLNYGYNYTNAMSYFPITSDNVLVVQNPANTLEDPNYNGSTPMLNSAISSIGSLSAPSVTYSKTFELPAYNQLLDIDYNFNKMYLAGGSSGDPGQFGGKDIYYVEARNLLDSTYAAPCTILNDTLNIDSTTILSFPPSDFQSTFSIHGPLDVVVTNLKLEIRLFCGTECTGCRVADEPTDVQTIADASSEISIYPNPAKESVNVVSKGFAITEVLVLDITGKKIGSYQYQNATEVNISLKGYAPGIYLIRINNSINKMVNKVE